MRSLRSFFIIALMTLAAISTVSAQERRPIDSQHPLWLVHIDVWNAADPQKIIDLVPDDIKPYVCMNLSMSCAYDVDRGVYQRPQSAIRTYKSWATVCQKNNMWFMCQPASGGHTHIQDDDLETFEYFFKNYPNFLGWNYAEQFWGFDEPGDKSSSSQTNRIALFAKLVPMSHKYGGFLTISFCGNVWSHLLNPVGMLKRNKDLMEACRQYPEAILWLYKYTTSSCFYNNESVSFGPFIAGLAKNYGVRYDNCGWNGAIDALKGENSGCKYPVAAGIGTVMEQTCQNGGAVWDGPELIWTEDFKNLNNSTDAAGYTQRNWGHFPGFDNAWIDMFRKIIDGTMYIPTREEVVGETKYVIINDVTSGSDEDKYATWGDLYDGLYKQTDPFNRNSGQWMDNFCYFKSTGRYKTIPMVPELSDEIAQSIPNKVKKSQRTTAFPSQSQKVAKFKSAYEEVSTGDLFVSRFKNQLVTYTPYTYLNAKKVASANIPLKYNTCSSLDLKYGMLSSGIIREYEDHIDFYLNNYRCDTMKNVVDKIVVNGATSEPTCTMTLRAEATGTKTTSWDAENGKWTIEVSHNGPVDLTINCTGAETDRRTDVASSAALEIPKQPEAYEGTEILEAEDLNYKNISSCITFPYGSHPSVRGHSGNGFMVMGSNTAGALKAVFNAPSAGSYNVTLRYCTNGNNGGTMKIQKSKSIQYAALAKTAVNEWRKSTVKLSLSAGSNTIVITNTGGVNCYMDQVIISPADQEEEKFDITVREVKNGSAEADYTAAPEGTIVTLTAHPNEGFALDGWNVIHGDIQISEDGTFVMPDDIVTVEPMFRDTTIIYNLDFTDVLAGTLPEGWIATQENGDVHSYPNSYGSGGRVISGFPGTYPKALYWRMTDCQYGTQAAYPLTLKAGKYRLIYAMAAWNGSSNYKAQILRGTTDEEQTVVAEGTTYSSAPNCAESTSTDLSSAVTRALEFEVTTPGKHIIKFNGVNTGWQGLLLTLCKLKFIPEPALKGDVNGDGVVNGTDIQAVINFIIAGQYDKKADVNNDGVVNGTDIQEIINIIVSAE